MNYASVGIVDYDLAAFLIVGTLPGVYLGTRVNSRAGKEKLKKVINVIIFLIGAFTLVSR